MMAWIEAENSNRCKFWMMMIDGVFNKYVVHAKHVNL